MGRLLARKKSLHHLTRKTLSWRTAISAMSSSLQSHSDQTAAIIASSAVEVALESAIKTRLRRLKLADTESLFGGTGPLATFSAKIQIGYALGIFGPETRHDLTLIKDIRNVFAHNAHNYSFRTKRLKEKCLGIHISKRNQDATDLEDGWEIIPDARHDFLQATRLYLFLFKLISERRTRLPGPPKTFGDLYF
jgi:DNA-binding MltR family transcriptional regulator